MKRHPVTRTGALLALSLLALVLVAGCGSTAPTGEEKPDEEVNVGYGTQQRGDVTGSVSSVSAYEIEDRPVQQTEEMLQGRFPGVNIIRTSSGGYAIRIRGAVSFTGSTAPLYVVDGMPVEPAPDGSLSFLNPSDIEKIDVLKDAASTAIYGSRGANGVVLITTKRPPAPAEG